MRLLHGDIEVDPPTLRSRWFWLRHNLAHRIRNMRRPPGYTGRGQWTPRREYGGWALRPHSGWRRFRWVTFPLAYTRAIPAEDQLAAAEWGMEKLGM